jgi:flagellin
MAFQVNSNVTALNVYNNLSVHQTKSSAALARISSGLKAAGGGDIASQGTAATLNAALQATQSSISQVQNAINRLQAADAAYGELIALGQKGQEAGSRLADAGADSSALQASMTALTNGITSIQTNTQVNGTVWTSAIAVDVGGGNFAAGPTLNVAAGGAYALLLAATVTTPGSGTTALYTNYVEEKVNERATNAGNLASMQNTLQVLNSVAANEVAGIGEAQDTDIAKEMMNLTSANIMTDAATAMLAQAMQLPNAVLRLIQ